MDKTAVKEAEAFKEHIGKVIKKNRDYRGKIQSDLAGDLDISEATLSRYEKGKSEIKASTMAMISHICGFDMIEYIPPFDNALAAQIFRKLVRMAGIDPYLSQAETVNVERYDPDSLQNIHMMEYLPNGRVMFTARIDGTTQSKKRQTKTDILYDFPNTQPLPLCNDDYKAFELHLSDHGNRDRLRILLYGYRLMMLFLKMDTPYQTTSSMSKQILRRIIKTSGGEIDPDIYDYYWKCVYDKTTVDRY